MRSTLRFLLVMAVAIAVGFGIYHTERGAIQLLTSYGLISNDSEEFQAAELQSNQSQPDPMATENDTDRRSHSILRPIIRGVLGIGAQFTFFMLIVFIVILIRKSIEKIPLPKSKKI